MATGTYAFMYKVSFSGGTYSIADGSAAAGLNPVAVNVNVRDTNDPGAGDNRNIFGDIPNDGVHVGAAGHGLNGNYFYVGSAADQDGQTGFVIKDGTGNYYLIIDAAVTNNHNNLNLTVTTGSAGETAICFMAGTKILAASGEIAVEALQIGDLVRTSDGRDVPVRWIGRQTISTLFRDALDLPIRVRAGALAENVPCRDLLVSPDHALFIDGVLIHAGALVNGTSITRERDVPATFVYYHVEVGDHSLILAENTPAETFVDNVDRAHFDNWAEYEALYAEGGPTGEMPLPRAKSYRQVPMAIREKIAARAHRPSMSKAAAA